MSVLKLVVGVPRVLASVLLWVVTFALLPPTMGLVAFVTGAVILGLLAAGVGERAVVRLLAASRTATPGEEEAMAPLAVRLAVLNIACGREVLVRGGVGRRTLPAQLVGDGVLLVTPWLVAAPGRGWLSLDEAVALVVHADGRRTAERPRAEVAMLVLSLPARAVVALGASVARGLDWVPFLRFAWSMRAVVGAVAVVQQIAAGRPLLGVFAGVIVGLTYLAPAAAREKAARVEAAADALVVCHGLGPAYAELNKRYRLPVSLERMQRLRKRALTDSRQPVQPRLELVRG